MNRSFLHSGLAEDFTSRMGQLEAWAYDNGFCRVAGVDEVGRGPLAGPVVAAAVLLPKNHGIRGLNDSKQLSSLRRERLVEHIQSRAEGWGIGQIGPDRIDSVNIRRASLEAMSLAFKKLIDRVSPPDLVLVDGRDRFAFPKELTSVSQHAFVKADARSESVAAASILAKVHRDALMQQYHLRWPQYGFDQHKGYPTKAHKQAIQRYGLCEVHRLSFKGCQEMQRDFG